MLMNGETKSKIILVLLVGLLAIICGTVASAFIHLDLPEDDLLEEIENTTNISIKDTTNLTKTNTNQTTTSQKKTYNKKNTNSKSSYNKNSYSSQNTSSNSYKSNPTSTDYTEPKESENINQNSTG